MHPIGWAQSTGVAKIAHGRASLENCFSSGLRQLGEITEERTLLNVYSPPRPLRGCVASPSSRLCARRLQASTADADCRRGCMV